MSEELPSLVTAYIATRDARLASSKELKKLESAEKTAFLKLVRAMEEAKTSATGDSHNVVKLKYETKPKADDWDAIYGYIMKSENFQILHRRLGAGAIREIMDMGETIPGISFYDDPKLTISKALL